MTLAGLNILLSNCPYMTKFNLVHVGAAKHLRN